MVFLFLKRIRMFLASKKNLRKNSRILFRIQIALNVKMKKETKEKEK